MYPRSLRAATVAGLIACATQPALAQTAATDSPAVIATAPPAEPAGYEDGFRLATGPESFSLKMNGFVQARYTWLEPDAGDRVQNFDLALARLALGGGAFDEKVSYLFQLEASTFGDTNRLSLLDGWIQYRLTPSASVKAGRILLPYSRQFLTHPGNLLFTDLSAADYAFNLPRATGVHAAAERGRFSVEGAVANSVRALDAAGQQNHDGKLAVLGRAELAILKPYGYLESSPAAASAPQLSVGVAAHYNPVGEGSSFQSVRPGDRTRGMTVDAGYRGSRVSMQAAWYARRNEAAGGRRSDRGGYAQAGFYLVPRAWELAGRVSFVDFGNVAALPSGPDTREYEAGVNRYLHGHNVKLQGDAGLVRRDFFGGVRSDDRRIRVQLQLLF